MQMGADINLRITRCFFFMFLLCIPEKHNLIITAEDTLICFIYLYILLTLLDLMFSWCSIMRKVAKG